MEKFCLYCNKELKINKTRPLRFCNKKCYFANRIKNGYTYHALHVYLFRNYKRKYVCEHCGILKKRTEFALKKGIKYSLKIEDYLELCHKCHDVYDEVKHDKFRGHKHTEASKRKTSKTLKLTLYKKKNGKQEKTNR